MPYSFSTTFSKLDPSRRVGLERSLGSQNDLVSRDELEKRFPLHAAARDGDVRAVKELLAGGKDPCGIGPFETRPLHWTAQGGKWSKGVARLLVAAGCPIDVRDWKGRTPLFAAVQCENLEAVKGLVALGADAVARDERGWSPFHAAVVLEDGESAARLVSALAESPFADPTAASPSGKTPAGVAKTKEARIALAKAVRTVFGEGADEGSARFTGKRAGEAIDRWVRSRCDPDVLLEELRNGLDPDARTSDGSSLVFLAALHGSWESLEVLFSSGADPNTKRKDGKTALSLAGKRNYRKCAEVLLFNGADPNVVDADGRTPLYYHAAGGMGKKLLESGADPNIGDPPLNVAIDSECWDTAAKMLDAGADPTRRDKRGLTALDCVERVGLDRIPKGVRERLFRAAMRDDVLPREGVDR